MRRSGRTIAVAAALVASACNGPSPPAPVATPGPAAVPAPPAPKEPEVPLLPPVAYEPRQRRDPFRPPAPAAADATKGQKGPAFETFKLVGVLSGPAGPMALVEGPDGIGYVLRPGDVLGEGRVTQITADAVRFAVAAPQAGQGPTEVTLRLHTN